ncbi:hypothetical protein Desdi_0302 [Desulfitobacterium dichloroeliminans LMG P-21439]|uniref:Uncharacterized protein n=1 Tax=Desulfitobacterium dichloroeliminans (strain LMG P-21439 / DCA1) TaxID=871963 RepID=L0F467_DESDL|nr:hypothetical protein [Desulfitobacterium dichloroeliminans]AGA67850.1 hypothetical protein Desdi_0302 [Desulfitobacterium dichloroeliminans LMG P-21439]
MDVINLLRRVANRAYQRWIRKCVFLGTSTIQTRAKYFLIVSYALADIEHSKVNKPKVQLEQLDSIERLCGEKLIETSSEGCSRSLKSGSWVKRTRE